MKKLMIFFILLFVGIAEASAPEFRNSSSANDFLVGNYLFEARFNSTNAVRFTGPNSDSIIFRPSGAYVRGDATEIKLRDPTQESMILKNSVSLSLSDNYLPGTETIYTSMPNGIKFHLIMPQQPALLENQLQNSLDIDFELQIPDNLLVAVNGEYWDKLSEIETAGDVVFYREGVPRFYFPKSYGTDADGNTKYFAYRLWKSQSKTYLTLEMDTDWLLAAKYPVVIDPSAVAGCTETDDLVNCSDGTFSGNWIDTSKSILISSATIDGVLVENYNNLVRLNSTGGDITIRDSTINANGGSNPSGDGGSGYLYIYATEGKILAENSIFTAHGGLAMPSPAQMHSAGSGSCNIYGDDENDISIRSSTFNCYGMYGRPSSGGDAGDAGSGNFYVFSGKNIDINLTTINAYGGKGGDASDCGKDNGGNAGIGNIFINVSYNIAIRENNSLNYYNGVDGNCVPGSTTGTGHGRFYSVFGHIAFGNGTWLRSDGGSGSFQNFYRADKLTFGATVNITTRSDSINNITILPGGDNKLGVFNTNMPQEHLVYCTGTLNVGRSGRTDQNLNFDCSAQNITQSSYGGIDWLWGDGTGLAPPVMSNFTCSSCTAPGNESPYQGTDTTPTFTFSTDIFAWCRIADEDMNYSAMGSSRDCESGENTQSHTCTLPVDDELIYPTDYVYVSCRELYSRDNTTTLLMSLSGLESTSDTAIVNGISSSAIWPGASIYNNIVLYVRNKDNKHIYGTFDKVASYRNKRWAFNYVSEDEASAGAFYNLTPAFYYLELANMSGYEITNRVRSFINETR